LVAKVSEFGMGHSQRRGRLASDGVAHSPPHCAYHGNAQADGVVAVFVERAIESRCDKLLTVMDCAECKLLADQAAVAAEEVEKIRERIVAGFSAGSASPALIKSLEGAERTYERCVASAQRHAKSHHGASSSSRTLQTWHVANAGALP